MSKDRDWVDYAQLGLFAVQAASLAHISGQMGGMASELSNMRMAAEAQAHILRDAQQEEAAKARRLSQMRQMVWLAEQFLNKLESESRQQGGLQRGYVYSLQIEDTLTTAGVIPPDRFDDWADKDRVGAFTKRIAGFRERLAGSMTEAQRGEAELCWRYMKEDEDLSRLIETRSDLEKRQAELKTKLRSLGGGD